MLSSDFLSVVRLVGEAVIVVDDIVVAAVQVSLRRVSSVLLGSFGSCVSTSGEKNLRAHLRLLRPSATICP